MSRTRPNPSNWCSNSGWSPSPPSRETPLNDATRRQSALNRLRTGRDRDRGRRAARRITGHGRSWGDLDVAGTRGYLCRLGRRSTSQPEGEPQLLEEVGTSSNALSKAAYDVVSSRTETVRPRRVAAAAGYVGTELAKEVPYSAAALGAAFVSDTITSHDALVFLAGTNLGAAVYEYGLGRVTRVYLQRRARRTMP
jgi:hypothetical protein